MMRPTKLYSEGSKKKLFGSFLIYKLSGVRYLGKELDGELERYLRRELERLYFSYLKPKLTKILVKSED